MVTRSAFATTVLVLVWSAGAASAGEGNGDPFPFRATAWAAAAPALRADTGSDAYPQPTGNNLQPSCLAQLEPAPGSEAPLQTASSLPRGAGRGTAAAAQAQSLDRDWAARSERGRVLEVGAPRPRG